MRNLKGKNILVTGGAGFIGSHLVDRIIQENPANLVIIDNYFLGKDENLAFAYSSFPALKVYRLDASDLAAMQHVVRTEMIDVVFNLAVIPLPTSIDYPAWTLKRNVDIVTTFCEIARTGLCQTLIHCSSSEAYGTARYIPMDEDHPLDATTPYAASKLAGDSIVLSYYRTYDIDTLIVRPFNTFGPRQNLGSYAGIIPIIIQRVKKKQPIEIYGDGEQTRDYVFVSQTVEAFIRAYMTEQARGKVINVATGQEITINRLVRMLLEVLGIPDYPIVYSAERFGDVRRHCGDNTLSRRLLDFTPSVILKSQLEETVAWYLERI